MRRLVADALEVLAESGLREHVERIAADANRLSGRKRVMLVEHENGLVIWNRASIRGGLAVILAGRLEIGQLE